MGPDHDDDRRRREAGLAYVKNMWHTGIADRPLLLAGTVLLVTGVQFIMLGLLAEMQARTYHESQDKPIFVIKEIRQSPADDAIGMVKRIK